MGVLKGMITEVHLKHWIKEIRYQLKGLEKEIDLKKVKSSGIMVDGSHVSFDYIREKTGKIKIHLKSIENEIKEDKAGSAEALVKVLSKMNPDKDLADVIQQGITTSKK